MHIFFPLHFGIGSTCSSLVLPANGQIAYATDMDPEFDGETTATYSCVEGYGLNGGDVMRTCEGSPIGSWSGSAPTCEGIIVHVIDILL